MTNQGPWERLIGSKPAGEIRRSDMKALADHLRDRPSAGTAAQKESDQLAEPGT